MIFVDDSLVPVLEKLAPSFETVEHYVVMGDGDAGQRCPNALRYEELLERGRRRAASTTPSSTSARRRRSATRAARPATRRACSTRTARSACTRSATLMTRRASGSRAPTACWRSCRCSTPTPGACRYGAALAGADLILPDRFLQAEPLAELIAAERPTLMGCVPTIFADLLRYADEHPEVDLSLAARTPPAAARRCRGS